MPDPDVNSATGPSPDRPSDRETLQREIESLAGDIIVKLISRESSQQLFQVIVEKVLTAWAGTNPAKRVPAALLKKTVPRMKPPAAETDPAGLAADIGGLLKRRWQLQAAARQDNPRAEGERLTGFLREFLENTDFSEWKAAVEAGRESRLNLFQEINQLLPDYHGKALVLLAALPSLISVTSQGLENFFETQLEVLPPDMLFEINEGVNDLINWPEVGQMLNDYHELRARLHTGSLLAGDDDTPALQEMLTGILDDITTTLDMDKLVASGAATAGNREALENAVATVMTARPEFGRAIWLIRIKRLNARIRTAGHRLRSLTDCPEESFEKLLGEFEDSFDSLELADFVSVCLELVSRIQQERPDFFSNLLETILTAIDPDDLRLTWTPLINEFFTAIKPVAAPLMPAVINGISDLLTPEPGQDEAELKAALNRLNSSLRGQNLD